MKSSEIANFIGKRLIGEDIDINGFSSLSSLKEHSVAFAKKHTTDTENLLQNAKNVLVVVCSDFEGKLNISHILSDNPRLDYLRIINEFFVEKDIQTSFHPSAIIENGAVVGKNVSIGAHCYVGQKVAIGDNTIILPNTSIIGRVSIGTDCYIKSGVVIGGPGFGFEYDEKGTPTHFPHSGEVIIGNNVFIGANSTIDRATIDATIIEDNVKIDNLVHIAHNCHIEKNTIITAGTIFSGGVSVGEKSWLSPNSTIHQKVKIGKNCTIGMGSVILRKVKDGRTVFGNPAYEIKL